MPPGNKGVNISELVRPVVCMRSRNPVVFDWYNTMKYFGIFEMLILHRRHICAQKDH